jgi:hypothetical protein
MMLGFAMLVVLSGNPTKGPPGPGPTAAETAKLYFLAGDIQRAQEWVQRGLKREPKTCGPLNKALAEYAFLANHLDEFTPEQAKEFLEIDRRISPTVRGKLTEKVFERYVRKPLDLAKSRSNGDVPGALQIVGGILVIDPKNADALALKKTLEAPVVDAGR